MREDTIFTIALKKTLAAEREAYLEEACASDPDLRSRVEARLQAHSEELGSPDPTDPSSIPAGPTASGPGLTSSHFRLRPMSEGPGAVIGPYKLREKIGEGGMGIVYLAEQETPVRRRIALKIIRPGMDTDQVVARFEAERQALAMMDHPCIARVFDAGATDTGRPYFVMELVKGVPITEYCNSVKSTTTERLRLFVHVCQAIQHAHQKGIIHRDVKPSNVLVTMQDGKPVPKVIDFGIAKATQQRLTERSLFTEQGAILGTLEYMSPEQAQMSAMDVDTRTDVYALGVLLYELLTGTTPLERARLREAGYAEILRRIREEEPPRPSTRLSESKQSLPSVAAQRRTEPARLTRMMRGELDWIVMKAIEKGRTRRYETASGFARDIERYLDGDPVEAGPPSASYRLMKFAHKHSAALVTAGAFAMLLTIAAAVSTYLAVRATSAEHLANIRLAALEVANAETTAALSDTIKAKTLTDAALKQSEEARTQAQAVSRYLVESFRKPDPSQDGLTLKVVDVLGPALAKLDGDFAGAPRIKGELLDALGQTYSGLGLPDKSVEAHIRARAVREALLGPDHPDTLASLNNLAVAYLDTGQTEQATTLLEQTLKLCEAKLGPDHPDTLGCRNNLGEAYRDAGRTAEAIKLHEETLKRMTGRLGPQHRDTLSSRNNVALAYEAAGRLAEATAMHEKTLELRIATLGPDHPDTLTSRNNLAGDYQDTGRIADAIAMYEANQNMTMAKLGPDHINALRSRHDLALAYNVGGRNGEAIPMGEANLKLGAAKLGPEHPDTLSFRNNLAIFYETADRTSEAVALHEANLKQRIVTLGLDHPNTLISRHNLARSLQALGRTAEAIALHEANLKLSIAKLGTDHPITLKARNELARSCLVDLKYERADLLLRESLAVYQHGQPDDWNAFLTRSLLGESLLGQKKFAEAEPLVLEGYEGMKAREAKIPAPSRRRLTEAANRIVKLYEAWDRKGKALEWRKKLDEQKAIPKA